MPNANKDYIKALSYAWQRFRDECQNMLRNHYAQTAPEASLEALGRERLVPRYPEETDLAKYRERVVGAWDENVGRGGYPEIIRLIEGYGFTFVSFTAGFAGGDPYDGFNLLVPTLSALKYDGTYQYDGTIKYNAVGENEIAIEIKRPIGTPVPAATKQQLQAALLNIVRASIKYINIYDIEM